MLYLSLSIFFFTCLFEFFCVTGSSESWVFGGCSSGSDRQVATGGTRMALESSVTIKPLAAISLWRGFKIFRMYQIDNITAAGTTVCLCRIDQVKLTLSTNHDVMRFLIHTLNHTQRKVVITLPNNENIRG